MSRTLRYWGYYLRQVAAITAIAAAAFLALGIFRLSAGTLIGSLSSAVTFAAAFVLLIGNLSAEILYLPLGIAMGDTRRGSFWGYLFYRAVFIAGAGLIAGVALLLDGQGLPALLTSLLLLCIVSAVSSLFGCIYTKFKVVGIILIILICGLTGGVAGFLSASENGLDILGGTLAALGGFTGLLAAIAAIAVALDLTVVWLLLRRQAVKL